MYLPDTFATPVVAGGVLLIEVFGSLGLAGGCRVSDDSSGMTPMHTPLRAHGTQLDGKTTAMIGMAVRMT